MMTHLRITGAELPAVTEREARHYWQAILATLYQRGLLQKRQRQGGYVAPQLTGTLLLPDRIAFILNMQKLGGISREVWASDHDLWRQWRAALDGRVIFVTDSAGLAITVGRDPRLGERLRALPVEKDTIKLSKKILLTAEDIPSRDYAVRLGYAGPEKPVDLCLDGAQRAILVGGTSGFGKTTFLLSVLLQLASKHRPAELQLAVVDLKEVDFSGPIARLPHYFRPVAYSLSAAETLIERVEGERVRRQALLHQAEVSDWEAYNALDANAEPLPLLLLVVDEIADLADSAVMATLIQLARKGRATGISLIAATQHPTGKVLDAQIKANLPTAIAFRTKSQSDSRVILDQGGAEKLRVRGRALTFLDGWQIIQTLYVDREIRAALIAQQIQAPRPALTENEVALVRYALVELDGFFNIDKLYAALGQQISRRKIVACGKKWELRGWLTPAQYNEQGYRVGRRLTDDLIGLLSPSDRPTDR